MKRDFMAHVPAVFFEAIVIHSILICAKSPKRSAALARDSSGVSPWLCLHLHVKPQLFIDFSFERAAIEAVK